MPITTIDLNTQDGVCKTQISTPAGAGPWPSVILCFDAGGQRPAISQIAQRIADRGYLVAIPDFFYRVGSAFDLLPGGTPREMKSLLGLFGDPELRAKFASIYFASATSYDNLRVDVGALLAVLAKRSDVRPG